jgi:endopeptidase Clp ATP-binding regulatory subunit ClpX
MSEDKQEESPQSLESQLKEMLRKASLSFVVPQASDQPSGEGDEQIGDGEEEDRLRPVREFDLKPRDIRDYLDRFVVRQDEAKKVLAVAICDHYNHVRRCLENPELAEEEYAKHNIILLGPTGVGKTYLMRCIARLIRVPFVKADATKFTETGYVGHDVEDLVRDLVKAGDGDTDLAQYGIIYLDEIDKIAAQATAGGKDVSGRGVQINLLKLMEETEVGLFSQTDLIGQMQAVMDMQRGKDSGRRTINTRHMLFIVSGAFDTLAEQVRRRVGAAPIGFTQAGRGEQAESTYLRHAQTRDFIDYGFEPEFIGRLPVRVVCDPLSASDLAEIMRNSEGSILAQYRADFEGYGIDLRVSNEAIAGIAEKAHTEKTGARGLMTVLEKLFRNYKFELPSLPIAAFEVDKHIVEDPDAALQALFKKKESARRDLLKEELKRFADRFREDHGIKLTFAQEAVQRVIEICLQEKRSVRSFCDERFHDLEYALKLIARNTGKAAFTVTRRIVERPSEELSRRVARSFKTD